MSEIDPSAFRVIRTITPVRSVIIAGLQDEPLVVNQTWPDGKTEIKRIVNPERSYQVPTFIFWDETVSPTQQGLVREAFDELFTEIGFDRSKVQYLGNWRESGYRDSTGKLVPHKSIEWQLQSKWNDSRRQIKADEALYAMFNDPYQTSTPHWEVVVTNKDLYSSETNFVIGAAMPDLGTIISLSRLEAIRDVGLRGEAQKTEIFHEFSHVLGLPTNRRGSSNLDYSLGPHCRSAGCSMKQGLNVPTDWMTFTTERLRRGGKPLCGECVTDLAVKFKRVRK